MTNKQPRPTDDSIQNLLTKWYQTVPPERQTGPLYRSPIENVLIKGVFIKRIFSDSVFKNY